MERRDGEARSSHEVWLVEPLGSRRARWTRIGIADVNVDGTLNVKLTALPLAGGALRVRATELEAPDVCERDDGEALSPEVPR